MKPEKYNEACTTFADTNITICQSGKRYLGGSLGGDKFARDFMGEKVSAWVKELDHLAKYAAVEQHAAFAALTHGLIGRWVYAIRVSEPVADDLFQLLETAIRQKIIPALTAQPPPNDEMRKLFALPARLGGLGITNPMDIVTTQRSMSEEISQPLVNLILHTNKSSSGSCTNADQQSDGPEDVLQAMQQQKLTKRRKQHEHQKAQKAEAQSVIALLPAAQRECALAGQEKGVSSWLGALPIERAGFSLHKGAFRDAIALRYNLPLPHLPQKCTCGEVFTINHALVCRQGDFPFSDTTACVILLLRCSTKFVTM